MTHASLFSGIGGFDLAAEWAGWTNLFNCEIDPFCRRVLKYHFPNSVQYEDIRTTDFTVWRGRIDVLTGGFPCQPFSCAGKRKGTDDDRYLWPWASTFADSLIGRRAWFSTRCSLTWKLSATKFSRLYFQLVPSALPTGETVSGLLPTVQTQGLKVCENGKSRPMNTGLLPTPRASDFQSPGQHGTGGPDLRTTVAPKVGTNSQLNPLFVAEMMGFPADWTVSPFQAGVCSPSKPTETR